MSLFAQIVRVLNTSLATRRVPNVCLLSSKLPRQGIIKEVDPETGAIKTKKTTILPKITLISGDSIVVTTLQDAEKISKRRDLKLVKIMDFDTKTERPVYKLMSGAEYHAEDLKQREKRKLEKQQQHIKGEKVLLVNSKIALHDLDTQLRRALKWIKKMYEVRVIISGPNGSIENSEKVYSAIEQYFKNEESEAKILQKRAKGSDIKFQIVPPKSEEKNKL